MKDEKKQAALKVYESTMINAADVRREAINKAESQYKSTQEVAHKKFVKDSVN